MNSQELNEMICEAHFNHYKSSKTGLVNPDDSPNANTIYHLYNDGEITHQKGGFAYLMRTEFTFKNEIYHEHEHIPYNFPITKIGKYSYAILTQEECFKFRSLMNEIYQNDKKQ